MISPLLTLRRLGREVFDRAGPPPVLIGHCHAKPVFDAAAAAGFRLRGFNFWTGPQPALNPERTAFHPEIAEALARGPVFSAVGGGVHTVIGLVRHPRPFDFVLPQEPELAVDAEAEVLPFAAVRRIMAAQLQEYLDLIELVRASASGKVFHIEAPPPVEDETLIAPDVPWDLFAASTGKVSPAPLRYKLWRLHSELVDDFCRASGVTVIARPADAVDRKGYLKPSYYTDATHVNAGYGALVLKQMRAAL